MEDVVRKSAQEVEIDHLLAEEFHCDPSFGARFLSACGLPGIGYQTREALAEPSLGGQGFGDLLIEGDIKDRRIAILVEDKITAGPSVRQAERYAAHAARMRDQGWDQVWTVLVAPAAYRGERESYDASLDLETLVDLLNSPDPKRLAYRRGIIERALDKRAKSGVKIPDIKLHKLKSEYLEFVTAWCARERFSAQFPPLREKYYDGDSWIEHVRHPSLPEHVELRHRFWTSAKDICGQVDLISTRADNAERQRFHDDAPEGSITAPFSNGKGVQVSFQVPELRQGTGLSHEVAEDACRQMRTLVAWYLGRPL